MEIKVNGIGEKFVKPDQIRLDLRFTAKGKTYEEALELGVKSTKAFHEVMEMAKLDKDDLKTTSFRISKARKYDEQTRQYYDDGFEFSQNASLKFEYDMTLMANIMEKISLLKNPPTYIINFCLKDEDMADRELTKLAVDDARRQAENIALACGKTLKDCVKASFEPFEERMYDSCARFEGDRMMAKASVAHELAEVFVPEDVQLSKTVYTLWICE